MALELDTRAEREGRPRFRGLRIAVRDRVEASPRLRRFYGRLCAWRARREMDRGRRFPALGHLLHAEKHGGGEGGEVERLVREACCRGGALGPVGENLLLSEWVASAGGREVRRQYTRLPLGDRVRMRLPRAPDDPERQGNLIVLKAAGEGEKGVLLLKYNPAILDFCALFDLSRIAAHYMLVLEPSWWGYRHPRFFPYLGRDLDVVVQCQYRPDFDYIAGLHANLVPVRLGPSDWTDPAAFSAKPDGARRWDLVMVAAWSPFKRHEALFAALAELRRRGRRLETALVGYPWDWTRSRIERLLHAHGVADQCTIFERVPHAQVAEIFAEAKASLFLSRDEGSPKALYESIFCGTPPIVYRRNRGIDLERIREPVGLLAGDGDLADTICDLLDRRGEFDPRGWALRHTGYANAARILNEKLRALAPRWTRDVAAKKNAPHLRYAEPGAYRAFAREYERLAGFLLPLP